MSAPVFVKKAPPLVGGGKGTKKERFCRGVIFFKKNSFFLGARRMDIQEHQLRQDVLRSWYRRAVVASWTMRLRRRMVEVAGPLASDALKEHVRREEDVRRLTHMGRHDLIGVTLGAWWDDRTLLPDQWKQIYDKIDTLATPPPPLTAVDRIILDFSSYWTSRIGLAACRRSEEPETDCMPPLL